jgi:hypothetical protein
MEQMAEALQADSFWYLLTAIPNFLHLKSYKSFCQKKNLTVTRTKLLFPLEV